MSVFNIIVEAVCWGSSISCMIGYDDLPNKWVSSSSGLFAGVGMSIVSFTEMYKGSPTNYPALFLTISTSIIHAIEPACMIPVFICQMEDDVDIAPVALKCMGAVPPFLPVIIMVIGFLVK